VLPRPLADEYEDEFEDEDDDDSLESTVYPQRVAGTPKHQAVLVSDRAIGSDQGQKFVFVVDGQGTVQSQRIVTGPIVDGLRVVRSGLKGDEQVIVAGTLNARPGGKVKVETADMNSFASDQVAISTKVKATK